MQHLLCVDLHFLFAWHFCNAPTRIPRLYGIHQPSSCPLYSATRAAHAPYVALAVRNDRAPICDLQFTPFPLDTEHRLGILATVATDGTLALFTLPTVQEVAGPHDANGGGKPWAVELAPHCSARDERTLFTMVRWFVRNLPPRTRDEPDDPTPEVCLGSGLGSTLSLPQSCVRQSRSRGKGAGNEVCMPGGGGVVEATT